ncbi:MAG: methylenetetrahydrofolate reductase [Parafannyhessea sp.]|uniref:methylenetetrahydrofolate reductase n=1 Tax=Parafannyhessea sp. TaxID=2847324 RepID=UPI003F04FF53
MRIDDILRSKQTFSYEIFPPKGDMSMQQATSIADELTLNHPDWISVTFSAGGSGNSQHTVDVARAIQQAGKTQALAHLTCLGSSRQDVDAYVRAIKDAGVQNVLALRGDRAPGREAIDFEHASDLVSYLKDTGLCVGAACYPEGHVESASLREDVEHLKAKVDAGADFLVTQLFFDNDDFYRFRDLLVRKHIKVPVVVGIMPFTSVQQIQRMAFTCGASIPAKVIKRLVAAGDDKDAQREAGIAYACEQLVDLAQNGVDGLHIYTMNRPSIGRATHDCLLEAGYLKE